MMATDKIEMNRGSWRGLQTVRAPPEDWSEISGLSSLSVFNYYGSRNPSRFPPVWQKCKIACYPANIWLMCVIFLLKWLVEIWHILCPWYGTVLNHGGHKLLEKGLQWSYIPVTCEQSLGKGSYLPLIHTKVAPSKPHRLVKGVFGSFEYQSGVILEQEWSIAVFHQSTGILWLNNTLKGRGTQAITEKVLHMPQ